MDDEQERCPWCKARKFDPPKKKCSEPNFHWLLAGREWHQNGEGEWKPIETRQAREEAFDGLLVPADREKEAEAIGTVTIVGGTEQKFRAVIRDGELKLVADSEVSQ